MGDDSLAEAPAFVWPCAEAALRVVAAASWHVVRERRFSDFPRVLSFVETVAKAVPELVPFRRLFKLRLGLQAKIVMNMLEEDQPPGKIYDALDTYFPENQAPLCHSRATADELEMLKSAQENFRGLLLLLLSDCTLKELYVEVFLERDYGEVFMNPVEWLFYDYICQLEHILPKPEFEMLLEAATIQTPDHIFRPSATLLNQYFSTVRYPPAGCAEPPTTPLHLSPAPCESEYEDPYTPPLSLRPGSDRSEGYPSPNSEWDLYGQYPETLEGLVPESESETSTLSFQGEYQDTHFCTLIPTFQEYLRERSSQIE